MKRIRYTTAQLNAEFGKVGHRYYDAYWREEFDVLSHDALNHTVTIRWVNDGRTSTHRTRLDRRDRLVGVTPALTEV